jgi:hypothetical protein
MALELRLEPPSGYPVEHAKVLTVGRILELVEQGLSLDAELWHVSKPYCHCAHKVELLHGHNDSGDGYEPLCEHEKEILDSDCLYREPLRELEPGHEDDGTSLCFRIHGRIWEYAAAQGWGYARDPNTPEGQEERKPRPYTAEQIAAVNARMAVAEERIWCSACGAPLSGTSRHHELDMCDTCSHRPVEMWCSND